MDTHLRLRLNQNNISLSYKMVRNIIKIHGSGVNFEEIGLIEGWKLEQIPQAFFAKKVVFDSEDSKLMFYLKYGTK